MNDVQMHALSLQRHQRALAREAARAADATPPSNGFEQTLQKIAPVSLPETARISPVEEPQPAPPASQPAPPALAFVPPADTPIADRRILTTGATPNAPTTAIPELSAGQAALLAASMGATLPPEPAETPAIPAVAAAITPAGTTPELSNDQMSALMAAFGQPEAPPQASAAMEATAIPQAADDNLRYFPINRAHAETNAAAQVTASDAYLRAMQQMDRNLGAYGGLTRSGR